ncbi:MAG: LytTR family DNA-binding domain-containing protein [Lachnospiraceae bacterium]|nr:LytTR family DNA-binding domain-containing protein [Lachnospiraceae bacterium]MDD3794923.1 LytTR family DNA-binding domain-containing protein [Lachnospiraceae bacterium]
MKLAIVDDDEQCRRQVVEFVRTYMKNTKQDIEVEAYSLAINFISEYRSDCDVIFLDVEMPHMDGISAAKKIREVDKYVPIIFLTSYSQYAINGYEVNAIDYVMKPLTYFVFEMKLKKALKFTQRRVNEDVVIVTKQGVLRLPNSEIMFACSEGNNTAYHTVNGIYRERMTMRDTAKKFKGSNIAFCSSGCLINLSFVTRVVKDVVYLGDIQLQISRSKRKEFIDRCINSLSEGG